MSCGNDGDSSQFGAMRGDATLRCVARSLPRRTGFVSESREASRLTIFSWFARSSGKTIVFTVMQFENFFLDRTTTRRCARFLSLHEMRALPLARSHLRRKRVVVHAHAVILHKTYALRPGAQNKLVAAIRHVRSRRPTSLPFSLISIGTVCLAGERTRLLRASHVLRSDLLALDVTTPIGLAKLPLGLRIDSIIPLEMIITAINYSN